MKFYNELYQNFGVRKADQLASPPHPVFQRFEFPRESIFHYFGSDDLDKHPHANDPMFAKITHPIYVSHVLENGDKKGNPRRLPIVISAAVRQFHIQNRRYKQMNSLEAVSRDQSSLVIYNYGFINGLYAMMRSTYSHYYTWWNRRAALWDNVAKVAEESDRHQFIQITVPKSLPTLSELAWTDGELTASVLKTFTANEQFEMIELWKWFGALRHESLISRVPKEKLDKINFIIVDHGRWFMLNLGRVEAFRKATKEELKADPKANTKGIEVAQVQRRFLHALHVMADLRSEVKLDEKTEEKASGKAQPVLNPATGKVEMRADILVPEEGGPVHVENEPNIEVNGEPDYDDAHDPELDAKIEEKLTKIDQVTDVVKNVEKAQTDAAEAEVLLVPTPATPEDGIAKVCARLAEQDAITASELVRYTKLSHEYKNIVAPDGKTKLDKFIEVPQEMLKIPEQVSIPDIPTVVDKTMLNSSLQHYDSHYIKHVLPRHVSAMVMSAQQAGVAVTEYEVEKVEDAIGAYESHRVKLVPVVGSPSTVHFKIPVLEEDGTYKANGIKYNLRKQRVDLPIRKVSPDLVALTSYFGKVFVSRSAKRVNNYNEWLCNAIMAKGMDEGDHVVQEVNPGDVFDNEFDSPKVFSALSQRFRSFKVAGFQVILDKVKEDERKALYGEAFVNKFEKDGARILGIATAQTRTIGSQGKILLIADKDSSLYTFHPGVDKDLVPAGTLETMAHLEVSKAPIEFAEVRVMDRQIPVGFILAFELGFDRLCRLLKVEPRRVQAGTRINLDINEYAVVFKDETLIFSKEDRSASMILAGFNEYHRYLREYDAFHFNKRDVYLNVLEGEGPAARYLREIDLMYQMFVDPVTKSLLEQMKEPTDFRGLLLRSCELLLKDQHPDEYDTRYQRFRGNERIAGAVYSEMVKAIRQHNGRAGRSKLPIDLHPYAVWKLIATDSSNALVSEINPIQNLKEMEAVTTGGVGGRNSRSMTKRTRGYPKHDMGVISESTVDSGDVGINTYTSANPQFDSVLGTTRRYDLKKPDATALLSTSALVSPGADIDDPKRVNFIAIQHSHGIACKGYHQMPVRTGYEQIIPHRTGDLFCQTAKKPGRVISISDKGIVVQFDGDDQPKGYELGRRFGNAAGLTIPHSVVTPLKEGAKFKEGAVICYNTGFFEPDILNPGQVVYKTATLVNVALLESTLTLEDSSAISPRVAEMLTTKTTKVNTIVVRFNQKVSKLVKTGSEVEAESILCVIEDEVTATSALFDQETIDTLSVLQSMAPQAKTKGHVEMIEVYYHGEKEDMSESLKAIADASDREMGKRLKAAGKKVFTGKTDEGFRVEGNPLMLDTLAIKIYITGDVAAGVGDKGVFANQMKTVFGEVLPGEVHTASGLQIDAIFGQKSIDDRIVGSPAQIGTTTAVLRHIGKMAARMRKK